MRLGDLDALEQIFLDESKRLREYMDSEDCSKEEREYIKTFLPTVEWARKTVHRISTIDAVPVVRCKDCKHYWKNVNTFGYSGVCATVSDNDFCSYGERGDG